MARKLAPNQTLDPARGSFLIRPRMVRERIDGRRVFVAPTEPVRDGSYQTYDNSIQFVPLEEK